MLYCIAMCLIVLLYWIVFYCTALFLFIFYRFVVVCREVWLDRCKSNVCLSVTYCIVRIDCLVLLFHMLALFGTGTNASTLARCYCIFWHGLAWDHAVEPRSSGIPPSGEEMCAGAFARVPA